MRTTPPRASRVAALATAAALAACLAGCSALVTSRDRLGLCGDGELQAELGEECDDGNTTAGDGCSTGCTKEVCGNGIKDAQEACDLGSANDNAGDCTLQCTVARCGDSHAKTRGKPPFEVCDDGNKLNGDGCNPQCSLRGRVAVLEGIPAGMGVADGTGAAARFAGVYGVESDSRYLYLSDFGACSIRRMKLDTGAVETVAGSPGDCQFTKDGAGSKASFSGQEMPLARVGPLLYVGERHILRRVELAGDPLKVDSCVQFKQMTDNIEALASDPADQTRLFVATRGAVYQVKLPCTCDLYATSGQCSFSLLAGGSPTTSPVDGKGAAASFSGIQDLALAPGKLYIADAVMLRELDLTTNEVKTRAGAAQIGHVDGVGSAARFNMLKALAYGVVNGSPSLYAAELSFDVDYFKGLAIGSHFGWGNVRRIDPTSWKVETIAGSYGTITAGQTSEVDGFGPHVRFVEAHSAAVVGQTLYLGQNAAVRAVSLTPPYQVTTAAGVLVRDFTHYELLAVASSNGRLYYGTRSGELLERPLAAAGPTRAVALCSTAAKGYQHKIEGIAAHAGLLYVLDGGLQGICRVDPSGKQGTPCCAGCTETCKVIFQEPGDATSAYFAWRPMGLASDGNYLYFPDSTGERLMRVDAKGGSPEPLTPKGSLPLPWGVAYIAPHLYVSSPVANVLTRVDPKTKATQAIGDGLRRTRDGVGAKASFCGPAGLATDGKSLFVGESYCGIFKGEWHGHGVRQVDLSGGTASVTTLVGPGPRAYVVEGAGGQGGVNWPASMTYDPVTRALYVADNWDYALLKID